MGIMTQSTDIFPPPPPPPPGTHPDISVAFILSPRFTILPFAGFIDCLRHAADVGDHSRQIYCRWTIIAPVLDPVRSSCGLEILPQQMLPAVEQFDYLVVVGGLLPWCMDLSPETYDYLRQAAAQKITLIGLCTGGFILANAGLLDGRRCGVHFEHKDQFEKLFPKAEPVTDEAYVTDHGVITCPGGPTAIDLAFTLIETCCGKARAIKGLTSLLMDKHRSARLVPHRPYGHLTACGNRRVELAVELMERNFSTPYSITKLARKLSTSERGLNRVFQQHAGEPPTAVWRKMRLAHGHWLLINSARTVTRVALECGFADGAHFSRWFKRTYGETPTIFRKRRRYTSLSRMALSEEREPVKTSPTIGRSQAAS
jgi:transcriptional regulator GlxA family with amidase domain